MKQSLSSASRWRAATLLAILALTAQAQAQKPATTTTYTHLKQFEQTKLQELLAVRPTTPSSEYNAKLVALGYKNGIALNESDLSVRIARAELHKQFYLQSGDTATAAKVESALVEMRSEQATQY